jgi:type I restriction enzyme S subunit
LELFINSLDLQEYVTGTAQPKLTQAALNRIPVPLPPLPEQREIVRRVDALFKLADRIEAKVAAGRRGRRS